MRWGGGEGGGRGGGGGGARGGGGGGGWGEIGGRGGKKEMGKGKGRDEHQVYSLLRDCAINSIYGENSALSTTATTGRPPKSIHHTHWHPTKPADK